MSKSDRIKVKRQANRGHYDESTINAVLDKAYVCHVGFVHQNSPVVIPTLYGRKGKMIFIHGSHLSRMLLDLEKGVEVCLTVTINNGIVLARSLFHHSMNYESVVIFGKATEIESDDEKIAALKIISDQIIPGRWEEGRFPNEKELNITKVLKVEIIEASAKKREGMPSDNSEDYELDIWAGILPVAEQYGEPLPDNHPKSKNLAIPKSVLKKTQRT